MFGWLKSVLLGTPAPATSPPAGSFVESREDDAGWRPISATNRDLSPVTQKRMQELAHHAWEQHRIANRLIELPIAFILGDGAKVTCTSEEAQVWVDQWWSDPINRLDLTLEKRVRELALFGEQVIIVFTGTDGHIRHGAIDPSMIQEVVVDPDNAALPIGVMVRDRDGDQRTFKVLLDGDDASLLMPAALDAREKMTAGVCHFWRVNDLLTGSRGRSDLLSAIDIADAYSQLVFGEVERAAAMRMAMWDVTLTGATEAQVKERASQISPPSPMSIRVHNDAEKWDAISPKLESADASETLRVIRNEVLGGGSIPEHWYGGGGDVNRATAAEMDEPTYKVFRRRQLLWQAILEAEARHVIRSHLVASGRSPVIPDDMLPKADFPAMQSVDVARYAQALAQLVGAVASAIQAGLLTEETGVALIASVAEKFGIEIDPVEELKKAQKQKAKRTADDVFRDPPEDGVDPAAADDQDPPAAGAGPLATRPDSPRAVV